MHIAYVNIMHVNIYIHIYISTYMSFILSLNGLMMILVVSALFLLRRGAYVLRETSENY